jgi:hypothetical protein
VADNSIILAMKNRSQDYLRGICPRFSAPKCRFWVDTGKPYFKVNQLIMCTLFHLGSVQVGDIFDTWKLAVSFIRIICGKQSNFQRPSGRASRSIEIGEVPTEPQRTPTRMATVVTRLFADAFSVCGGANFNVDNLHKFSR